MILFLISFLLIFISAYCFASCTEAWGQIKTKPILVYTFLFAFAEIILSFEILSLLNAINQTSFLIMNLGIFGISAGILKLKNLPIYKPEIGKLFKDVIKSMKRDKTLIIFSLAIVIFLFISFFLAVISPVTVSDAMIYHVPRAVNWIVNSSINHVNTVDMRINSMPINSELIFALILMYLKSDIGLGIVAFLGYINTITTLYCFLGELGYCIRKRLWTIFVFSGFAFVVVEASSCDMNLFTGSMILTSIYLFYCAVKYNKDLFLVISSLSLAIACGVKTTALIALPSVFIISLYISFAFYKNSFYKYILKYFFCFAICFLLFSSYNYILNIVNYGNLITTETQYELNKFRGGEKIYLSNLIKYGFIFFDFSGFQFMSKFYSFIQAISDTIHVLFGLNPSDSLSVYFFETSDVNINFDMIETRAGFGILGFLAVLPAIIISLFKFKKTKNDSNKKSVLKVITLGYIFNILLFSGIMVYTVYNTRYLNTFAVMVSPILVLTYIKSNKNLFKWLIIASVCYYLVIASQNHPYRMTKEILNEFKNTKNIHLIRNKQRASLTVFSDNELNSSKLANYIVKNKIKNSAFFANYGDKTLPVDLLRLNGYKIKYFTLEEPDNENLNDYDIIIVHLKSQSSNNIKKYYSTEDIYQIPSGLKVYRDEKNQIFCNYVNYKNNLIDKNSEEKPVYVNCQIPYEKFEKSGFKISAYIPFNNQTGENGIPNNQDLIILKKVGSL